MKARVRVQAGDATGVTARPVAVREYKAARPDRLVSFGLFQASPARLLQRSLRGLIDHSRVQARNNDYVRGYLGLVSRNVVGAKGIALQSLATGRDGKPDSAARLAIVEAWRRWCRRGVPTLCGGLSWRDLERLVITTVARDGTFLARHVRGAAAGAWGYRLQVLSVDHLDLDRNVERVGDGGYVRNGLQFDALDRLVGAWLFEAPRDEARRSPRAIFVPERDLLVVFRPEEPTQTIGRPWMHTTLRNLAMVDGFEEAAVAAARWGASKAAFFKRADDDGAATPADQASPQTMEAQAGELGFLPPGWDITSFDPAYPDAAVAPFVAHMLRRAATGLRTSYFTLSGDTSGMSFSNLRAALGEEREEWRELQDWLASAFHDRVFAEWLQVALVMGRIAGVTQVASSDLERLRPALWRPRTWASITPKEEATTWAALHGLRALPFSLIAERMGYDRDELLDMWAEDARAFEAKGVPLPASDLPGDDDDTAPDPMATAQTRGNP